MRVFRISSAKYANKKTASGLPGRWNGRDQKVLYTSENISLAILETLVHVPSIEALSRKISVIEFADDDIYDIRDEGYQDMAYLQHSQKLGTALFEKKKVKILKVPSVVNWYEYNYIINTDFPEAFKITAILPWEYDDRLIRNISDVIQEGQ